MNLKERISGEYISPLILIICFCIGHLIKCSFDFIDNRYIPTIVTSVGVGMYLARRSESKGYRLRIS